VPPVGAQLGKQKETLQHTATHCNTLQQNCHTLQPSATGVLQVVGRVGGLFNKELHDTLHHIASYCNTLQHTATHCNTLQHTATHQNSGAIHCIILHHTATLCNTLQHTTTHYNTMQQG